MHSENNSIVERASEVAFPTVQEVISDLRSSFFGKEFQNAAEKLVKREEHMNEKYIELKKKAESFEKEKDLSSLENLKLNDELKKKQKEIDALRKEIVGYTDQIKVLNSEKCSVSKNPALEDELTKKQSEIDELRKLNAENERRARVYKKRFLDFGDRVSNLEERAKELVGSVEHFSINLENNQVKNCAAESSRRLLFSKKTDSNRRAEPNFKEIIQIEDNNDNDGDQKSISTLKRKRVSKPLMFSERKEIVQIEDDDGDLQCISTLKRKQVSNEIKREHNNDDDDQQWISTLKEKRVSNEINRKINADYVDDILAGNQRTKIRQELHNQTLPSHPVSTSYSEGIMPYVKKLAQKNDHLSLSDRSNSTSDPAIEKFDEAIKSVVAKFKTRRGRWEFKADMLKELDKDDELCMYAICALHRHSIQGKFTSFGAHNVLGYDISRITQLGELLTDGDPRRKLKKMASELNRSDLDDCRKFAKRYSAQLFEISQTKYDPFFPPSRS